MPKDAPLLSPDIPINLTNCDLEPIHIPSFIQSHGFLMAAREPDLRIVYASENSIRFLGVSTEFILDRTLPELLGAEAVASIVDFLGPGKYMPANILIRSFPICGETRFDVTAHRNGGFLYIELEIASSERRWDLLATRLERKIQVLGQPTKLGDLYATVPTLIRELTGYDRVMVYRFDEDGHGEVVGEEKEADMEPFLGLHYPATDIPRQARKLYLLQRLRTIVDVGAQPVRLLAQNEIAGGAPLDMTYCGLRAASPIHLEYLTNMGVGASLAISLIHRGELWGMILCHHRSPRQLAPEVRAVCDLLGRIVSLLIGVTLQTLHFSERLAKMAMLDVLEAQFDRGNSIASSMADTGLTLALLGADGAVIQMDGETQIMGNAPGPVDAARLIAALQADLVGGCASSREVGLRFPEFANLATLASGAFLIQFTEPADCILWLRGEMAGTVRWGGNPDAGKIDAGKNDAAKSSGDDTASEANVRLSPRKSFAEWKQVQSGRSLPWLPGELDAAHGLQRVVMKALLRLAQAKLTKLRYYDPLTGLANRAALLNRLSQWQAVRGAKEAALVFLDLDLFSGVNERHGRATGDWLLQQVSRRLEAFGDEKRLVARFGGDEFVIFCEDTTVAEAAELANALLHNLRETFEVDANAVRLAASIGVAPMPSPPDSEAADSEAADPLRAADSAMYAAKQRGGNQVVVVHSSFDAKELRLGIAEELLERQRAATELAAAYAQLSSVMECTSDGVLQIGFDWAVLYGNPKAMESMPDLKVGGNFWECLPGLVSTDAETQLRLTMEQRTATEYEDYYAPYSQWFRVHSFPTDEGIGVFFSIVTSEKNLRSQLELEQLLREKRIEALSHMAGGLAHEISNPLAIIHARASDLEQLALRGEPVSATEVRDACNSIVQTSDRAIRILRGLRGFAREAAKDPMEPASIEQILDQCLEMQLSRFERQNIAIRLQIQPNIPHFLCRETQIGQIITNLLNNAFDAIVQSDAKVRWVSLTAEAGQSEATVDVEDSGPGVADHFKPHLMEPFFTTKVGGLGMGVGLSLSRAIAQDHGGSLTLRPDRKSTCFRLTLPFVPIGSA